MALMQDKETSPTFGFNSTATSSRALGIGGKNVSLTVYDLGGGKNIRRVWRSYLAEVHAVVFVVDAADSTRFEECKQVLGQTLEHHHLHHKPVLVFANKQDLPTAATAATVAQQLGLSELRENQFNILPCTARTPGAAQPDPRLREGLRWLVAAVDSIYSKLDARVQREAEEVRQEELRKKRERDERARQLKEERLRKQREQEEAERGAAQSQPNALSTLPGCVDSPKPDNKPHAPAGGPQGGPATAASPLAPAALEFSDLQTQRQDQSISQPASSRQGLSITAQPPHIPTVAEMPESPLPANLPSVLPNLPPGLPPLPPQQAPIQALVQLRASGEGSGLQQQQQQQQQRHSSGGLDRPASGGRKPSFTGSMSGKQNRVMPEPEGCLPDRSS